MIKEVFTYNKKIYEYNLASLSWGNLSAYDNKKKIIYIKPSGVNIYKIKPKDISVYCLKRKKVISGLKPSVDLKIHIEIYKNFESIKSICHTHSKFGTIFSQLQKPIKCIGTTHADHFLGDITITNDIKKKEILNNYEQNTGKLIVDQINKMKFKNSGGTLLRNHGPFCWGETPKKAFENSLVLEQSAEMYYYSLLINKKKINISKDLIDFHFTRKNGIKKKYGQ